MIVALPISSVSLIGVFVLLETLFVEADFMTSLGLNLTFRSFMSCGFAHAYGSLSTYTTSFVKLLFISVD